MLKLTISMVFRGSETSSETSQSTSRWTNRLHVGTKKASLDQAQPGAPFTLFLSKISHRTKIDECELVKKYGKLGAIVGKGSGGSIQLVIRESDGVVFAVKRFRAMCLIEDETAYIRKIKVEFDIGARLHHGNIIETFDLFEMDRQWYEVMEYAPYCLFEIVLSREMSTEEKECSFLQILAGVSHLHRLGYAHRDLKLENVVVTEHGIMKIIDFGSATMCRHPTTRHVTHSSGKRPTTSPISFHRLIFMQVLWDVFLTWLRRSFCTVLTTPRRPTSGPWQSCTAA